MTIGRQKLAALAFSALLTVLDQLIKGWALSVLTLKSITVIPGLFMLSYVENRGAAFGIFQNSTAILSAVSVGVLILLIVLMFSRWAVKPLAVWSLSLIIAGGAGNGIDRISRGFVVDYLDFSAIWGFPVFNLADCCVVAGTALLLVFIIYVEQRDERYRKNPKNNSQDEEPLSEQE
ncbi:MAG: signal peptidase II [Oscillospiraceae bacterium]|jgi:signal peptidase II|nr:signal peptidase II [Oscillospiraceae bacterium]